MNQEFEHFTIRLVQEDDAEMLYKLFSSNRPRLEDFFAGTVSQTKTYEDTKNYLASVLIRIAADSYYPYLVIDKKTNTIAGFVDVKNIDHNIPKAELGCFIDDGYANRNISFRALSAVCEYFLNDRKFLKLFLRTHPSNTAARKLAEKLGFQIEGTIRRDYKTTSGEVVDLIYYGKLNDD